uniref:Major capsid protein L1 n=1 Tax=Eidolon bat papillomavirus TaxID=3141875 RepID=A0AAU7E337_9PAPI
MSLWMHSSQTVYVAPKPVTKVPSSEELIIRTNYYYHAGSDRLLCVGNPYFAVKTGATEFIPKVSGNQYRVFRVRLPDPNKLALPDPNFYDVDNEKLVWGIRGIEVSRGGPLGMGVTGNPLFDRNADVENPNNTETLSGTQGRPRFNVGMEPKQNQLLIIGCTPALGEFWDKTLACTAPGESAAVHNNPGDCPGLELKSTTLQDGNMSDIGFGHINFKGLQEDRSGVPLEIADSICVYPDFLKMAKEAYGNSCFFSVRKEAVYTRHYFSKTGVVGEGVPNELFFQDTTNNSGLKLPSSVYMGTPSGSLVTTEGQILNRPYWLLKAQGRNNGILWGNQCFVTVLDNTRSLNFQINVKKENNLENWSADKVVNYLRHTEEYELALIIQLCRVPLVPETLQFLNTMDPSILSGWEIGVNPPVSSQLSDQYRFITSAATRCPDKDQDKEPEDPYKDLQFWNVDLTEHLSSDLDQFPLGRRWLTQISRGSRTSTASRTTVRRARPGVKRSATTTTVSVRPTSVTAKRRRR